MMHRLQSKNVRLSPEDEYTHPVGEEENFNESMYFNVFDHDTLFGGWFRVGNRPNEGHAEISICLYQPDGSAGFMFDRPAISGNDEFAAGGMKIEVIEPFKNLQLSYSGKLCFMKNPLAMANPRKAFTENPIIECEVDLSFDGISPLFGGEVLNDDGTPITLDPENSFGRAHYEQHMSGKGLIRVGDTEWKVDGLGIRDHSWGPRYWQAVHYYRWLPMNFDKDFGIMIMQVGMQDGSRSSIGMVLRDNEYVFIEEVRIESEWDKFYNQTGMKAWIKTKERDYEISGRVLSLVPLRNRRTKPDGEYLLTRIAEGMTEYTCDGKVGYGMSEYLDQIVDGKPVGADS
jgi:hypothetical protein